MHRSILFAFIIVLSNSVLAQKPEYSDYHEVVSNASFEKIIGTRNGHVLILTKKDEKYLIQEHDTSSLLLIAKYPINLEKDISLTRTLEGVFLIGSSLKIIYKQNVSITKEHSLCLYDCDANGIIPASQQVYALSDWESDDFIFFTSNEKKDCLLFGRAFNDLKSRQLSFETFLIEEKSASVQKNTLSENIVEWKNEFKSSSIALNNQREIIIYSFDNLYSKTDYRYHSQVILKTYNSTNAEIQSTSSFEIPVGYSCAELLYSEIENRASLTGIYQNHFKEDVNGFVGLFRASINENGELAVPTFTKYTEKTRLRTLIGAETTEGISVRPFYTLNDQLIDSKGNTYVIQERQSINTDGEFYFGSLIVSKLDSNGTLLWDRFIPKSQFFRLSPISNLAAYLLPPAITIIAYALTPKNDEGYLSYKATMVNDEIQILFNDNPENKNRKGTVERVPYVKPDKGVPYSLTIKDDGTFNYQCREDLKPSGEPFVLQNGYYLNGSYLLVSKDKKRGNLLSKVRF